MSDPVPGTVEPQHRLGLYEPYYAQVESGRKAIEVRVRTPRMTGVAVGDVLVFRGEESGRELDVRATRITPYASFDELLAAESISRIDPDATCAEQLLNLRRIYPPEKEALTARDRVQPPAGTRGATHAPVPRGVRQDRATPHGVQLLLRTRRPGSPVQLRSVYGGRPWQFPGGNTDAGEDPLETARRETAEETGLQLGQGQPRLLLTHYLHPGPRWPIGKIGFIFDGGTLTAEQLRQIRLDPAEHDLWATHGLAEWQHLMGKEALARLEAVERARAGRGPQYLVTGPT
jgi:ASC-1-like (ASCH) protein/8-oxo-dGTP pyrophosphatase MutT (NUDIX family)